MVGQFPPSKVIHFLEVLPIDDAPLELSPINLLRPIDPGFVPILLLLFLPFQLGGPPAERDRPLLELFPAGLALPRGQQTLIGILPACGLHINTEAYKVLL